MKRLTNFEEFEGEIIKYSDYIADKVDPDDLTESLNNIPVEPKKSWTVEDSQQLSSQITGARHPWSRSQYNEFTHPDVKKDISYEEYINMWNMKAPEDQRVILEHSPGRGLDVERFPDREKPKAKKLLNFNENKTHKPINAYGTSNPYQLASSSGRAIPSNSGGTSGSSGKAMKLYDSSSGREFYYDPTYKSETEIKSKLVKPKPTPEKTEQKSGWALMKLESRIMITFMIISAILSFITVLILMLK